MQQRQLVACAAFPHNTWRLCNSCFIPSPRTLCATSTSSSSCAPHSSRSIVCHAATPPQPGQPGFPQQQGFGGQYPGYTGAQSPLSSRDSVDDAVPSLQLPNIPRPVPPRPPPALSWMPPQLLTHLRALLGFLRACWELLPEFVSPSFTEATRRLCLVLGASLVMVVLVSTIDSGWLYLHLLNARRVVA